MLIVYICEIWIIPKLCPYIRFASKSGGHAPISYGSAAHGHTCLAEDRPASRARYTDVVNVNVDVNQSLFTWLK